MDKCSQCSSEFDRIGLHWSKSSCDYPTLTERQQNILEGLLMGDGWINGHNNTTPFFGIKSVNEEFLHWLDVQLGIISTGVKFDKSGKESSKEMTEWYGEEYDAQDVYRLRTRRLPELEQLWSWYDTGHKEFPENINISPTALKMWFVSDGAFGSETSPYIVTANEQDRAEEIVDQIKNNTGIEYVSVHNTTRCKRIVFTYSGTDQFFDYIGEPVPGFEYKWPNQKN